MEKRDAWLLLMPRLNSGYWVEVCDPVEATPLPGMHGIVHRDAELTDLLAQWGYTLTGKRHRHYEGVETAFLTNTQETP